MTRGLSGQHEHVYHVNASQNVIAFRRWAEGGPGDDVVVVANFANAPVENYEIGFPSAGPWKVRFNSDSRYYSKDFGDYQANDAEAAPDHYDGLPARGAINVGPYSVIILSQNEA